MPRRAKQIKPAVIGSVISYVQWLTWSEQKDDESGAIVTRYLRMGTTWSALALSYNNRLGQTVVLVQLFWVRGNANGRPLTSSATIWIFERPFDLREMKDFDLDVRKLKQSFPDTFARDEFRSYCERFCSLVGIENEMALRLLHKTQSAKNLGDLNDLLRDFMLEKPDTFEVADRLVIEFAELSAAHQAVVTAREQVQVLTPAHEEYQRHQTYMLQKESLDQLYAGVNVYRENRRRVLLEDHLETLRVQAAGLDGDVRHHESMVANQQSGLRDLQQQHRDLGGDKIESWEVEKSELERRREGVLAKTRTGARSMPQIGVGIAGVTSGFCCHDRKCASGSGKLAVAQQ